MPQSRIAAGAGVPQKLRPCVAKVAVLLVALVVSLLVAAGRGYFAGAAGGFPARAAAPALTRLTLQDAPGHFVEPCADYNENCHLTQCCADPSAQCFEKYEGWAACKQSCTPGQVDVQEPKVMQTPWTCRVLELGREPREPGEVTPRAGAPVSVSTPAAPSPAPTQCSPSMASCTESRCCRNPGDRCFQKHVRWAVCKQDCVPGVNESDPVIAQSPWSCRVLEREAQEEVGAKEAPEPAAESAAHTAEIEPAASPQEEEDENEREIERRRREGVCSGEGEDCQVFKCCRNPKLSCFEKDNSWAVCTDSCTPGTDGMSACRVLQPEGSSARAPPPEEDLDGGDFALGGDEPTTTREASTNSSTSPHTTTTVHYLHFTTTAQPSSSLAPTPAPAPIPCSGPWQECTESRCCSDHSHKC
jgi:hypothetical protein